MAKRVLMTIVCTLAVLFAVNTSGMAAGVTRWKIQTFWGASELPHKTFEEMCETIKVMSNGRLVITPYAAGAIVPAFEMLDAVEVNILQGMHSAGAYWAGKEPAFAVFCDLSWAWTDPWQINSWYYEKGGLDLLKKAYEPFNAVPVGVVQWGTESIPSKKKISSLEDMKGLKLRSAGGLYPLIYKKLGISAVILPGNEVYTALDKGIIEAADWGTPSLNKRLGYDKIAKYFIYPSYHATPTGDFVVNKGAWEKLPRDLKTIVEIAVRDWGRQMIYKVKIADLKAVDDMVAGGNVKITLPAEDVSKIRNIAIDSWDEWAGKSELSAEVVKSQKAWAKELGLID